MVADTGPRCTGLPFPKDVENIQEIEVQDPVDGSRAYVYLAVYPDTAPRSGTDYVTYNVEKNLIETTDYTIGYHAEAPISISRLAVPRRAGGSGQSVADRQKIRARAVTVWNILTISKNENDFRAEILAYTDGPVRVVRRTRNWVRLFGRVPSPSVELTSVYWKTGMQFPLKIRVPFRVPRFFEEAGLRVYVDTPPDVPGRKFYNAHNRQGMLIDGRMSEAERHVDTTPSDWQVVAGTRPEHREGWFSRQVMIDAPQSVSMPLYYLDDASTPDEPERYPGCFGCLGFELDGLDELEKGDYTILVQMFPLLSYRPGDEKAFLDIYDRPLVVRTKVLAKP
ncbi:MAG: hypothetical protein P9L99_15410 [Candidatus Lernaella stagnicola]|nr:hypothetical protein [Candidatus Lernaella stagnicola]